MRKSFLQGLAQIIVSKKKLFVKYKINFFLRCMFIMLQKKAKGFKRKWVLNPFQRAKKWVNNPIKCQRRFVGVFQNRFKKKLNLDIMEAIYLSCLKKIYGKNKKNGLITPRGYFATTLYDIARMSRIPLYYQEKAIQELESRGLIEYDPLEFDKYDENTDACVMFKII